MLSSRSMLGRIIVSHYNTLFAARCKNHNSVGSVPMPLETSQIRVIAPICAAVYRHYCGKFDYETGISVRLTRVSAVCAYFSPPPPLSPTKLFVDFVSAPPLSPFAVCPLAKHATHSFRWSSLVFRRRSIIFERGPGATRSISLHL